VPRSSKVYEAIASRAGPRPYEFSTIIVRSADEPINVK
jgi:hypothetical protein